MHATWKRAVKETMAKVANISVYLLNRMPTNALQKIISFEAWFGYKLDLQHLKIFGCLCFTYVPQVKRDKLDKKAEPGVFIGYNSPSKAYIIFQPQNKKILISRDVNFMEDKQWKWEEPEEKHESSTEKKESSTWEIINDNIDYESVRGTRSLSEIYESSNIAICEPAEFEEVVKNNKWIKAIKKELRMIEKNDTWVWWTSLYIKRP